MVMLLNYVDGDVPKWDCGDDDPLGVDVAALVVFQPNIKPKSFERSVMFLEDRFRTRMEMALKCARPTGSHLKVIDAQTLAEASSSCAEIHGNDYLEQFINDTLEVALEEIGFVVAKARSQGISVRPDCYADGILVKPARSFHDKKSLDTWNSGGKAKWIPSVRLQVKLQLDGPLSLVEAACEDIHRAVSTCGPLTFFEEHTRLPLHVSGAYTQTLKPDDPNVCA